MFIVLITSIVNASNHEKFVSVSNSKCEIRPTIINLHPNKYSQEFHYYPFTIKLDKCVGSYNTLNDFYNKVCVPNKTEDVNLSVFNMITRLNESKTLATHISCEPKCKFDGRICNSNQWWNNDKCRCECKKHRICKKDYIWNLSTCICENGKYLASIMDNSVITCDEIIEETVPTNSYKKVFYKTQNIYILLAFY